ncbi:hypothetical protein QCA50_004441 [Cerrena zonata]|uniref:Dynactin subunit 2 n=1 Tax=Cerrena zonata TaxID=2478898 RepID=A0AAW0GLK3_9APHY
MSANKYAGLPDIDTAPDVYETEDVFLTTQDNKADSSDDESAPSGSRGRKGEGPSKDELDVSNLMEPDEAGRKFRKLEKRQHRPRIQYVYPPSPTEEESGRVSPTASAPALPLSQRLKRLQAELAVLETELADPSNPLLHKEREEGHVEAGELIRGMVDVKGRLEKISKVKEGRGKLVSAVLGEVDVTQPPKIDVTSENGAVKQQQQEKEKDTKPHTEVRDIAEMDKRVGELEKVIGSSSTALDELSPLPPPILPLLTRLNTQLTLLTQPRHIDSISRRLKILLSDLERVSNANAQHLNASQRRQGTGTHQAQNSTSQSASTSAPSPVATSTLQEQLTPILTRLSPVLPHIPHILSRLRTLSTLHTQAASFQSTLETLEEEQRKGRAALEELQRAVDGVEKSWEENENVVKKNVQVLEERVEDVQRKLGDLAIVRD